MMGKLWGGWRLLFSALFLLAVCASCRSASSVPDDDGPQQPEPPPADTGEPQDGQEGQPDDWALPADGWALPAGDSANRNMTLSTGPENGQLKWTVELGSEEHPIYVDSILLAPNERLYALAHVGSWTRGDYESSVYEVLRRESVRLVERFPAERVFGSIIGPDAEIYLWKAGPAEGTCTLFARDLSSGDRLWNMTVGCPDDDAGIELNVGPDGTVYLVEPLTDPENTTRIQTFDSSGELLWETSLDFARLTRPAVTMGGFSYYAAFIHYGLQTYLIGLDASGEERWQLQLKGNLAMDVPPTLGPDGDVYIAFHRYFSDEHDVSLAAITANGELKWRQELPGEKVLGIAVANDGTIILLSAKYPITYCDASMGTSSPGHSASIIGFDPWPTHRVHAIAQGGRPLWSTPIDGIGWEKLLVDASGRVYVVAEYGSIAALSSSGELLWSSSDTSRLDHNLLITRDGTLVVTDGKMIYGYTDPLAE